MYRFRAGLNIHNGVNSVSAQSDQTIRGTILLLRLAIRESLVCPASRRIQEGNAGLCYICPLNKRTKNSGNCSKIAGGAPAAQ